VAVENVMNPGIGDIDYFQVTIEGILGIPLTATDFTEFLYREKDNVARRQCTTRNC
jgi:hypothetical protein